MNYSSKMGKSQDVAARLLLYFVEIAVALFFASSRYHDINKKRIRVRTDKMIYFYESSFGFSDEVRKLFSFQEKNRK